MLFRSLFVELARMRHRLASVADLDGYLFTMLRHAVSRQCKRQSLARRSLDRLGHERLDAGGFAETPAEPHDEALAAAPGATEIGDRREAIRSAIHSLQQGDVLLIAGKGHETGQIVGGKTFEFSDHDEVAAALRDKVA